MANGNIDYGPDPVSPGPGTGYQTKTVKPVGKKKRPPPSGAQPGASLVPLAPRAITMNTSTRFIEIDYNGNLITTAVTNMDFTGAGVIVSNVGSAVTINIPGSNGTPTGPNNSLQYNSVGTLAGAANLTFNPSTSVLSVIGNVQASYFAGDATRLFNIQGANIVGQIPFAAASNTANTALTAVTAGTVTTAAQPAITSVGTLTSVAAAGNITTTGVISATGNIVAAGNLRGGNIGTTGLIFATGNVFAGGNLATTGIVFANGTITGGNFNTSGQVSAAGNVRGLYLIGDGSQITNLPAGDYNNANVTTLLASFGSNVISATGNITTTANVTGGNLKTTGLISATGDITGGNVNAGATIVATTHNGATFSATGSITGGNINTGGIVTATGNVTGGNLRTVGQVSATGNITGSFFIGNGSLLTGLPATYSNADVQAYLPTYSGNVGSITATGNITVVNGIFSGNGAGLTGVVASGNVGSASQLANGTSSFNIPTADGIVVGNIGGVTNVYQFASTGVTVTGIVSATGNITGGNILGGANVNATTHTGATVSVTGTITGGNLATGGTASATGNVTGGNIVTAGQVSATGNITGSFFVGNGSLLTGIAASSYGNANVAANLAAFGSNPISTTGNVTAGNFIGNVVGGGAGTPTISSATNLDLSAASAVRVIGGGTLRLPNLSAAQIANIIASNGDMLYNTTVNKLQAYENGAWANII